MTRVEIELDIPEKADTKKALFQALSKAESTGVNPIRGFEILDVVEDED